MYPTSDTSESATAECKSMLKVTMNNKNVKNVGGIITNLGKVTPQINKMNKSMKLDDFKERMKQLHPQQSYKGDFEQLFRYILRHGITDELDAHVHQLDAQITQQEEIWEELNRIQTPESFQVPALRNSDKNAFEIIREYIPNVYQTEKARILTKVNALIQENRVALKQSIPESSSEFVRLMLKPVDCGRNQSIKLFYQALLLCGEHKEIIGQINRLLEEKGKANMQIAYQILEPEYAFLPSGNNIWNLVAGDTEKEEMLQHLRIIKTPNL